MEIVKGLKRNKIVGAGDVIKILFSDTENEESLFIETEECYVMVVHGHGTGKYHLVDLSNGAIVFSIDSDRNICDELNARVDDSRIVDWEVVDAKLSVSR